MPKEKCKVGIGEFFVCTPTCLSNLQTACTKRDLRDLKLGYSKSLNNSQVCQDHFLTRPVNLGVVEFVRSPLFRAFTLLGIGVQCRYEEAKMNWYGHILTLIEALVHIVVREEVQVSNCLRRNRTTIETGLWPNFHSGGDYWKGSGVQVGLQDVLVVVHDATALHSLCKAQEGGAIESVATPQARCHALLLGIPQVNSLVGDSPGKFPCWGFPR